MFKNKLKFARTAPNAIIDNPFIYGYRNLYENSRDILGLLGQISRKGSQLYFRALLDIRITIEFKALAQI